jgi:short-subunit dehydrogenase
LGEHVLLRPAGAEHDLVRAAPGLEAAGHVGVQARGVDIARDEAVARIAQALQGDRIDGAARRAEFLRDK